MQTNNYKIKKSHFEMTSHNYDKVRIESCNYEEKVAITRDRVIITIVEIMRNCRNCMLQLLQKSL